MKYNVSDVIDYNVITAFQRFGTATFILTIIIEIFYGIVVYLTTTKKVQFFRILTYIFICECILVEFVTFCWKPIRLFPSKALYPVGILAPMSSTVSAMLASLCIIGHACFIETLTIIVVERHFRLIGSPIKVKHARLWIYFLLAVTFLAAVMAYFNLALEGIDDDKVQFILKSEIDGIQQILDLQPSLYSLDPSINSRFFICVIILGIYGLYRIALFTSVLKENYKYVQNAENTVSQITQKQFSLMFHSTMIQFMTLLLFISFAAIFLATFFFTKNNTAIKYAYLLSFSMVMCYPIVDAIVVLVVVKGYRNTIKKLFQVVKEKTIHSRNNSVGIYKTTAIAGRRKSFFVY